VQPVGVGVGLTHIDFSVILMCFHAKFGGSVAAIDESVTENHAPLV